MNKTKRSLLLVFFALAFIFTACNSNQIVEETPIIDVLPTDVVLEEPELPTEEPTPTIAVVNLVSSDIVFGQDLPRPITTHFPNVSINLLKPKGKLLKHTTL